MADRKHTPDVLGEVLGEVALAEPPSIVPPARQASRTARAARAAAPLSQRLSWEYRIVSFQHYQGWRPRYINGQPVRDWTAGPLIHEYLQQAGEDGWEVAGASAGTELYGSSDYHQLYLKRPAQVTGK